MGEYWDDGPADYSPPDPGWSAPETDYNASTLPDDFSGMSDSPYKTAEEVQREIQEARSSTQGEEGWQDENGAPIGAVPVYGGQEVPPWQESNTSPGDGFIKTAINKWTSALGGLVKGAFTGAGSSNQGNKSGVPSGPIIGWGPFDITNSPPNTSTQQKAPSWVGLQMPTLMLVAIGLILLFVLGAVVRSK